MTSECKVSNTCEYWTVLCSECSDVMRNANFPVGTMVNEVGRIHLVDFSSVFLCKSRFPSFFPCTNTCYEYSSHPSHKTSSNGNYNTLRHLRQTWAKCRFLSFHHHSGSCCNFYYLSSAQCFHGRNDEEVMLVQWSVLFVGRGDTRFTGCLIHIYFSPKPYLDLAKPRVPRLRKTLLCRSFSCLVSNLIARKVPPTIFLVMITGYNEALSDRCTTLNPLHINGDAPGYSRTLSSSPSSVRPVSSSWRCTFQ
jgi:hypothetical protein